MCGAEIAPHMALLILTHYCQLSERAHVSSDAFIQDILRITMTGGKRSTSYQSFTESQ